mmetsp:Transcript_10306/g.25293  ORF Transcript_10306/g.25293 Transcript_10306/m.25293 type:complete len:298 (+) Transcript_10306:2224-3117(+)
MVAADVPVGFVRKLIGVSLPAAHVHSLGAGALALGIWLEKILVDFLGDEDGKGEGEVAGGEQAAYVVTNLLRRQSSKGGVALERALAWETLEEAASGAEPPVSVWKRRVEAGVVVIQRTSKALVASAEVFAERFRRRRGNGALHPAGYLRRNQRLISQQHDSYTRQLPGVVPTHALLVSPVSHANVRSFQQLQLGTSHHHGAQIPLRVCRVESQMQSHQPVSALMALHDAHRRVSPIRREGAFGRRRRRRQLRGEPLALRRPQVDGFLYLERPRAGQGAKHLPVDTRVNGHHISHVP